MRLFTPLRRRLSRTLFNHARRSLPGLSDTEREALNAGDVWWDRALFTGDPDWEQLLDTPPALLNEREQAFIEGPVNQLCAMLDEWTINQEGDLPAEVWRYLRDQRFFAMIIPQEYGGLGFSAIAHSEVIHRIASRSVVAAVTTMVPNSLGPGELLMQFGTPEQQAYWLPRLADGRELPCFALTSPAAGSDAAAMTDSGVVCRGRFDGEELTGIRLNWNKRYITLAPVATVLGLAFKLQDPDGLLGGEPERGITLALIPTHLPGIRIGRRHRPAMQAFQNGPTQGEDVFIPLDYVIGGVERVGQGWAMLMSALAAGRGISLPSLAAASTAFCARTSGAYAAIRQQFKIPIGEFEGIQEPLAALAADAYLLGAARRLTCAALDQGHHPSVISAIMKVHATSRMRDGVNHAMDIHAGKGVIDGPGNYLGNLYRSVPIGITVEGANILTRNMIIFGQGAIRCHPWLLEEMLALEADDIERFDRALWKHIGHSLANLGRAWLRSWTGSRLAPAPDRAGQVSYYRQLNRYAAAFALLANCVLLQLGGELKRREMLSARLGDILAELYLQSAVLKRWFDEGQQKADQPLVDYNLQRGLAVIDQRISQVLDNLPNRHLGRVLRLIIQPLGRRRHGPSDALSRRCARLLMGACSSRERLTTGLYLDKGANDAVPRLERAFNGMEQTRSLRQWLQKSACTDPDRALERGLIDVQQAGQLAEVQRLVDSVIAVDDFAAEALGPRNFTPTPDPP